MKECGIIFSAHSVAAILAGSKTQTRRIVRPQPKVAPDGMIRFSDRTGWFAAHLPEAALGCADNQHLRRPARPYLIGDRLWVRETFALGTCPGDPDGAVAWINPSVPVSEAMTYRVKPGSRPGAIELCRSWRKQSPIHMPRWASRLTLEITAVRVERLQDISEADAKAEGVVLGELQDATINGKPGKVAIFDARKAYAVAWDAINGRRAPWASNPYVWAVTFRRVETA